MYTNKVYNNVDVNKPPIVFRLTDREWEILEKEKIEEESINQTAARLLRKKLGIKELEQDNTSLEKMIEKIVKNKLEGVFRLIDGIDYRLSALEPKKTTRTKKTTARKKPVE